MRDLKKLNNSLEAILKNASSCVNKNNEEDSRIQARCEVLETLAEMKDMNLYNRLELINKEYLGVDLEEVLNISPAYYRERYYALLEIVARSINKDK